MLILQLLSAAILIMVIANIVLTLKKSVPVDTEKLKRELLSDMAGQQSAVAAQAKNDVMNEIRSSRAEMNTSVQTTMRAFADAIVTLQRQTAERQDVRLKELIDSISNNQSLLQKSIRDTTTMLSVAQEKQFEMQDKRLLEISKMLTEAQTQLQSAVSDRLKAVNEQFNTFALQSKESMDGIRTTVQNRLEALQKDNNQQLEKNAGYR